MVLAATVEPGDPDAARLVRQFSAVELLARLRAGRLRPEKAVGWAERLEAVRLATVRADTAAAGARFVVPGDEEWPLCADELAAFEDGSPERRAGAPLGLWIRGPRSLGGLCGLAVAIVGARAATEYGLHVAGDLAAGCASWARRWYRGRPTASTPPRIEARWPSTAAPSRSSPVVSTGQRHRASARCWTPSPRPDWS